MIAALPTTPESGSPAAIDLATTIRSARPRSAPSRTSGRCGRSPSAPRPPPAGSPRDRRWRGAPHELGRSGDEAALAELRLEDDRGDVGRRDMCREHALDRVERLRGRDAAVLVRERGAVDLRRERAHPCLVRVHLRGHRHREHGAAVEAALERDHGRAPRAQPRDLDRVLDRLGARVEERGPCRAGDRRQRPAAPPARRSAVRDDGEIGVDETRGLLLDRLDDAGMAMADVQTPTPPAKSMKTLPSTSVIVALSASAAKTGR